MERTLAEEIIYRPYINRICDPNNVPRFSLYPREMVKKMIKLDIIKDEGLSSKGCKTNSVADDSEAIVSVGVELDNIVRDIVKQVDNQTVECEQIMKNIEQDALNVDTFIDDSYTMHESNQDEIST